MSKIVIIIAGPTAVGKTALALQLATHYNTHIISADSRQCFREMNIGVAKPSSADLERIPHHFINSHSIFEELNAAIFEKYALQAVEQIFISREVVVMVGGTGLYLKAFSDGMDDIPSVPSEIREQVAVNYKQYGIEWLQTEIRKFDPAFCEAGEMLNPQRLMRALEVNMFTGKSIRSFQHGKKEKRFFEIIKIGVESSSSQLHQNINTRTDDMMNKGLVNEVRGLISYRDLNALRSVGYTEIFQYFDGIWSLKKAIEEIKSNTRAYAKRQKTWFKKDKEIKWFEPFEMAEILEYIKLKMQN